MQRISSNMQNNDSTFFRKKTEKKMLDAQNQSASGTKIQSLADDPIGAAKNAKYDSKIQRSQEFLKNMQSTQDNLSITENHIMESLSMLQRVRELAVRGANGTFEQGDRDKMKIEMEELLKGIIDEANATDAEGSFIFAGNSHKNKPFNVMMTKDISGRETVASVIYQGDSQAKTVQIDEGKTISLDFAGSDVFWAQKQTIISDFDAQAYTVNGNSKINIDGFDISLSEGDSIQSIISKINNSNAPVEAYLDPLTSALTIKGTTPHQIQLKDTEGAVLQDLKVIKNNNAPHNLQATSSGDSLFNTVINLRNALASGDIAKIGGQSLVDIDSSMDKLTTKLAELGSKANRISHTQNRLEKEVEDTIALQQNATGVDLADSITAFKELQNVYRATLGMQAKGQQQTLMDFVK